MQVSVPHCVRVARGNYGHRMPVPVWGSVRVRARSTAWELALVMSTVLLADLVPAPEREQVPLSPLSAKPCRTLVP